MKAWCRWCHHRLTWNVHRGLWICGVRAGYCDSRQDFDWRYMRYVTGIRDLHEPMERKPRKGTDY